MNLRVFKVVKKGLSLYFSLFRPIKLIFIFLLIAIHINFYLFLSKQQVYLFEYNNIDTLINDIIQSYTVALQKYVF